VDEMQLTTGCSSIVLIDVEGAGCSSMKTKGKKYSNSRRHPRYYGRKLQG
jgi:hypothetical protein